MALRVLLGAYAALLALVGLLPTPVDRPAHRSLGRFVAWCAAHGLGFVDYARIEFTANILWFVPFGLLLGLIFGLRRWWYAPLLCLAASVVIESAQGLLLPERVASLGDV
ncbi:MAG TPA: VanZ family protein, partial [Lacisediminihabitans sp.]|uniref:VanZ family protein n=1 Tax=Lacisediminihabitans sp. TaxID=2787631 RepID=UPI002EDA5770